MAEKEQSFAGQRASVNVVSPKINDAAAALLAAIADEVQKEKGASGKYDPETVGSVVKAVVDRIYPAIENHNEQDERRLQKQRTEERLRGMPEWDSVIVTNRPDLAKSLDKMPVAQRVTLAKEIEGDAASPVVLVGRFTEWTDPASLGPHALGQRAREAAAKAESKEG